MNLFEENRSKKQHNKNTTSSNLNEREQKEEFNLMCPFIPQKVNLQSTQIKA